jgi:hypothetical protein
MHAQPAQPVAAASMTIPLAPPSKPLLHGDSSTSAADDAQQKPKRRRRSKHAATIVNVLGFLFSSLLGLAIGYYVLCYVNPQGNFLNLPASWFPWNMEQPALGDGNNS